MFDLLRPEDTERRPWARTLILNRPLCVIAERAQTLTGASGAAIALRKGDEMVCRARAGRTAPDLGVRLQSDSGISADCVRTGEGRNCVTMQNRVPKSISPPANGWEYDRFCGSTAALSPDLGSFRRSSRPLPPAFAARYVATMQRLSSATWSISRLSSSQSRLRQTA